MFKNNGGSFAAITSGSTLSNAELKAGVELAIEGTDVRRDTSWDGYLNVTVSASGGGSDTVRMRMSPMMLWHHNNDAQTTYVTSINSSSSQAFRSGMQGSSRPASPISGRRTSSKPVM
jgi:protein-arginine deiminase